MKRRFLMKPPFLKRKALMRLRRRFSFFRLVRQAMQAQVCAQVWAPEGVALCRPSCPAA